MAYYKTPKGTLSFVDVDQTFEQLVELGTMDPESILISDEDAQVIIDAHMASVAAANLSSPTLAELQAQLATLTAQIQALAGQNV